MSTNSSTHPDLAVEQAYIEKVEQAFGEARARLRNSPASGGDKFAARKLREEAMERLREPIDPDALCFARIDLDGDRSYYLGRGSVHGDGAELLVVNWRSPRARPFYEATRSDPHGLRLRRRFQLQQLRLLGIVDEYFGDAEQRAARHPAAASPVAPRTREHEESVRESGASQELEAKKPSGPDQQRVPKDDDRVPSEEQMTVLAGAEEGPPPRTMGGTAQGVDPASAGADDVNQVADPQLRDAILGDMNRARGAEMRDIVATIEARQYELIADSLEGVLAIQGGPGTGKTAIALHRAAWLLFNHREELERAGVLVVGPNRAFMEYVAEVLPTLGETAVTQLPVDRLVDLDDVRIRSTDVPEVGRLKGDPRMADVARRAVRQRVRQPTVDVVVAAGPGRIALPAAEITQTIESAWEGTRSYVAARDAFRRALVALALNHAPASRGPFRRAVSVDEIEVALRARGGAYDQIWPTVTAAEVLRDLLGSRQRLNQAALELADEERALLHRSRQRQLRDEPWTAGDIALLDEIDAAIRGPRRTFGYVLADEVQDLTAMQLRMLARRSRQGRMTLVGDMAQATTPGHFPDWETMISSVEGASDRRVAELAIGYRLPKQIAELAAELLPRIAPDLLVPQAVRLGPEKPRLVHVEESRLADELVKQVDMRVDDERKTAVIVATGEIEVVKGILAQTGIAAGDVVADGLGRQVTVLTAAQAKGLEFDHVVVVDPAAIAGEAEEWGYVYIAVTRATRTLTIVHLTPRPFEMTPTPVRDAADLTLSRDVDIAELPATVLGPRYSEALIQAKFVHSGQTRRGTMVPYFAHLQSVAALVLEDGGSEDEAIAALLHDSVEDSGPEFLDRIAEQFGVPVARIVAACTDPTFDNQESWRELKSEHMRSLETGGPQVRRVALAEKLDNARALLRDWRQNGAQVFVRMDVDPEDLLWYQQELADLFVTERPGDLAWELRDTVERLLDLVSNPEAENR